jgi:hypothetical protein
MHVPRFFLALLCGFAPAMLQASRPTIIINRDPPDITVITNKSFTFGADDSGGGLFSFQNETGESWLQLDILVTLPSSVTAITCGSPAFVTCTAEPPHDSVSFWDIVFGPNPDGGIPNGGTFSINLNNNAVINMDPDGVGDWGPNTDFSAIANNDDTPEPASWLLMGAGIFGLAIYGYRRRASAV